MGSIADDICAASASVDDVLAGLDTSPHGVSEAEAAARLERYGPNELRRPRPASLLAILARQFSSAAVLVINTLIGFVTEVRARRAMEALLRLDAARASVLRAARVKAIDARTLVPEPPEQC